MKYVWGLEKYGKLNSFPFGSQCDKSVFTTHQNSFIISLTSNLQSAPHNPRFQNTLYKALHFDFTAVLGVY